MTKMLTALWAHTSVDRRIVRTRRDELGTILDKLKKKEDDLALKLANETRSSKRRHLELELAVTRLQLKKGMARMSEMQRTVG